MDINPIQPDPLEPKRQRGSSRPAADAKTPAQPKDTVEVSGSIEELTRVAKRLRENLDQVNVERTELLRAVQAMLEDGSLDDDQALADTADAILRGES